MNRVLPWLLFLLTRSLFWSYRRQRVDRLLHFTSRLTQRHPVTFALWHEHLYMAVASEKGNRISAIASRNSGGRLIGYVLEKLRFDTVYGSANRDGKDKGGAQAIRELIRHVRKGQIPAFAVDGSIGPRRKAKQGVAFLAQATGAAIVPVACVADRYWEFNTWDRFKLPKPFARIVTVYGKPISVLRDATPDVLANCLQEVEQELVRCEEKAQRFVAAVPHDTATATS